MNYLVWCTKAYEVEGGDGAPVHSSVAFDLTVTSLFSPLLAGRPVHLVAESDGPNALPLAMARGTNFSFVKVTPSHLDILGQAFSGGKMDGISRFVIVGGENLLAESTRPWEREAPHTKLVNEYGPTETVVGC